MAEPRFKAFISYSHADIEFARRMHVRLESVKVPPGIPGEGEGRQPATAP